MRFWIPLVLLVAACDPITLGLGLGGGYVASREIGKSKEKQERAVDRRIAREQQYYQEQDKSRMEAADQQIATQMVFGMLGGGLTNVLTITPDVRGGVVTLYGTVPSPAVADRAVTIARQTPGVREVVSRLNIMEMQITPTGNAWGHTAAPPSAPPPPAQNYAPVVPPESVPQGTPPPVTAYPEKQPPFMPMVEQQAPPEGSAVPREPITPPEQEQPVAPQGQYIAPPPEMPPPPAPQYQRPVFSEPEGTVPRTLPEMEKDQHY